MGNHIVLESPRVIRSISAQALRKNWLKVSLGYFIFYFISAFIPSAIDYGIGAYKTFNYMGQEFVYMIPIGSSLYDLLFTGVITFGIYVFFKTYLRTREVRFESLLEGFNFYGKLFVMYLLIAVKIFLWALLFVVPGIIASYKYSQAYLILSDNPDYSPIKCIKESCRLMEGNKGILFLTQLSYIGWLLLASIPSVILSIVFTFTEITEVTQLILNLFANIPTYFALTYILTGNVVFYDLLTERLIAKKEEGSNENN